MYDGDDVVLVCPAITTLTNQSVQLTVNNTSSLPITTPKGTHIATFSIIMSPNEHKEVRPVNPGNPELSLMQKIPSIRTNT